MTSEPEPRLAGLIVYIDHSEIREGRLDELKEGIRRLVEFIESLGELDNTLVVVTSDPKTKIRTVQRAIHQ